MTCQWLKSSKSLNNGVSIINQLEETKFEQFLNRIVTKLKEQDAEVFTEDEKRKLEKIFMISEENLNLAIKTIAYLFKRMLKFIYMPADLKNDLKLVGLNSDKAEIFVKLWSTEARSTLNELGSEQGDAINFAWKLNAELSSDYSKKIKIPKAYLSVYDGNNSTEMELTHSELYTMFLQFESIQSELDNLM